MRDKFLFDEMVPDFNWEKIWSEVNPKETQARFGDDQRHGAITVLFGGDSDAWLNIKSDPDELGTAQRFRTYAGGGRSLRVRKALFLLALAIKADNEEFPQDRKD
jgi:hypothetical protein